MANPLAPPGTARVAEAGQWPDDALRGRDALISPAISQMREALERMAKSPCDFIVVDAPNETSLLFRGGGGLIIAERDASDSSQPGPQGRVLIEEARRLGSRVITDGNPIPRSDSKMSVPEMLEKDAAARAAYEDYRSRFLDDNKCGLVSSLELPTGVGVRTRAG